MRLNIIPQILEIKIRVRRIRRFSFKFLFCLNNTNSPTPELDKSPDIQLPKVITLLKYNSVIIMLEAQLGIKPIIEVIIGVRILLVLIKFITAFRSSKMFIKIFTRRIKAVIFKV